MPKSTATAQNSSELIQDGISIAEDSDEWTVVRSCKIETTNNSSYTQISVLPQDAQVVITVAENVARHREALTELRNRINQYTPARPVINPPLPTESQQLKKNQRENTSLVVGILDIEEKVLPENSDSHRLQVSNKNRKSKHKNNYELFHFFSNHHNVSSQHSSSLQQPRAHGFRRG